MAQISVPTKDFMEHRLPGVCAITGTIARNNYALVARSKNGPVLGGVPLTAAAVTAMTQLQRLTVTFLFVSLFAMALAVATQSLVIGWIAFALIAASLGLLVVTYKRGVRAKLSDDGQSVLLTHVHDNFVNAFTSPPGKCGDCTGSGSCSTSEMKECENIDLTDETSEAGTTK